MKPPAKKASPPASAAKATAKKSVVKAPAKKITRKPVAGGGAEPGYQVSAGGLLVPETMGVVVTPSKFRSGLKSAQAAIQESIGEFTQFMSQDMEVFEIGLSISFNAEGKFLGFGVGGATSVTIKIRPKAPSE